MVSLGGREGWERPWVGMTSIDWESGKWDQGKRKTLEKYGECWLGEWEFGRESGGGGGGEAFLCYFYKVASENL